MRKLSRQTLILAAVFMAASLLSCGGLFAPLDQTEPTLSATVNFAIPEVAPSLQKVFSRSTDGARAYMFAPWVEIVFYNPDSTVYASQAFATGQTSPGGVNAAFNVVAGNEYTVEVSIYDAEGGTLTHFGSQVCRPTVENPDIYVAVLPSNSTEMTSGASLTFSSSVAASTIDAQGNFTALGDEAWCHFTAPAQVLEIQATPIISTDMVYIALYNVEGRYLSGMVSQSFMGGTSETAAFQIGVTQGETYYLGFIGVNQTGGSITVNATVSQSIALMEMDAEDNDSMDYATALTTGSPIAGTSYDPDWYTFTLTEASTVNLGVKFDAPVIGCLSLHNAEGHEMYSDYAPDNEPRTDFGLGMVYLDQPGDYYVRLKFMTRIGEPDGPQFTGVAGPYSMDFGLTPGFAQPVPIIGYERLVFPLEGGTAMAQFDGGQSQGINIVEYHWELSAGPGAGPYPIDLGYDVSATAALADVGVYTVKLTVTDAQSNTAFRQLDFMVRDPAAFIAANADSLNSNNFISVLPAAYGNMQNGFISFTSAVACDRQMASLPNPGTGTYSVDNIDLSVQILSQVNMGTILDIEENYNVAYILEDSLRLGAYKRTSGSIGAIMGTFVESISTTYTEAGFTVGGKDRVTEIGFTGDETIGTYWFTSVINDGASTQNMVETGTYSITDNLLTLTSDPEYGGKVWSTHFRLVTVKDDYGTQVEVFEMMSQLPMLKIIQ